MSAPARVFQPVRGRGLRRWLWKRLHLPHGWVHPALRAAKRAANPAQVRLRRELARELRAAGRPRLAIDEARGFRRLAPEELPGAREAAERCAALFDEGRAAGRLEARRFNPRKDFLRAVLAGPDFHHHPELLRLLIARPILDAASVYLGAVPLLAGAALWWTPPNDTALRSQLFHFDAEDDRQVKLFLNVRETGPGDGPVTWLPADCSDGLRAPGALRRRIPDAEVDACCGAGRALALTGGAGSGALVDTSRCLHYGSRGSQRDRLVLMAQWLRFDSPSESTFELSVPAGLPGLDPDPVQALALGWSS